MENTYIALTERAIEIHRKSALARVIVALAGPPGSGKSTIAAEVAGRINRQAGQCIAVVLPMDGFHYPRAYLDTLPNRAEAYSRRGAHWTFDAEGVLDLVKTLHSSRTSAPAIISAPSFDHATKDPVEGGIVVAPDAQIVIIEGNWLLFDCDPWKQIRAYVDDTWFVDVDEDLALQRVASRHLRSGVEASWASAFARASQNDLLNGEEIRRFLIKPSVVVRSIETSTREEDYIEPAKPVPVEGQCIKART
ncbi:P-loop containing nucleoside triphosphate hydrolase protein [Xylaria sp. FL0064]|nr:P-loop containing nucleoside triphosphate hydrolase protein [Xylaria sp. FL0064]